MTIQFRTLDDGRVCCASFNERGERVAPRNPCDACAAHFAGMHHDAKNGESNYPPPDIYSPALRAATADDEPFEVRWKRDRLREVEATRAALAATERPTYLATAEDLKTYAAPDIYAEPLRKMREERK
jgi:hypothetical protein